MVREHYDELAGTTLGMVCCPGKGMDRGTAELAGYADAATACLSKEAPVFSHGCGTPVSYAEIGPGDTVLDLGSGAGLDLFLAAARTGPAGRAVGVEMAEGMLTRVRLAAAARGVGNVKVIQGVMESLPLASACADRVISNCAVCLSPEKEKVFAEIHRVLRPGGRVVVSDIFVSRLPSWAKENVNLYRACIAGALEGEELLRGLSEAGFADLQVRQRTTFDEPDLETFLLVGTTGSGQKDPCSCSHYLAGRLLGRTAEKLRGKVGSITLTGRVPP
jgi:ubiquinone/menaquinone biosynthesis C-methylase UbiE